MQAPRVHDPRSRLRLPSVPSSVRPLLEGLEELGALVARDSPPDAARRAQAGALRGRLLSLAPRLAEELPAAMRSDAPEHRLWFTQGALLWMHFAEVGGVRLDTVGSLTLTRFPVDLEPRPATHAHVRAALGRAFGWSPAELAQREEELGPTLAGLRQKTALTALVVERYLAGLKGGADADRRATGEATLRLMRLFYGDVPFRAGDVDLVVTATALFFCIPYHDGVMEVPAFADRPRSERRAVRAFLEKLAESNTALTDRFPSFGWFDRRQMSPEMIADLTAALGPAATGAPVGETLATMVSILPTQLVEQYLIHDGWGHVWQEALLDFEAPYRKLVHVTEPLTPESGPLFGGPGTPRLADAFREQDGRTVLDEETLARFAAADLEGRIQAGLSAVLSEVLADLVEHKFVRRVRPGAAFTSSSMFPDEPVKLDLTLKDVRAHVGYWRRAYRRLMRREGERRRLTRALAAGGLPRAGLSASVDRAAALLELWFGPVLTRKLDSWRGGSADGELSLNVLHRVMLNVIGLDAELDRYLAEGDRGRAAAPEQPAWRDPASCIDLLVLLLGWFYERDRAAHVWHLDELVRDALRPTMARFRAALDAEAAEAEAHAAGQPGGGRS